jgi:outer membrane protein TolC
MRNAAAVRVGLAILALSVPSAPVGAQEARPDTLASVVGRSVEELVAGLPGESVSLADLVAVALEHNLDLEVARAERHLADADLQTEQGLFDPTLSLGWGVAREASGVGRSGTWSSGLFQALPWGTEVGVSMVGTSSPAGPGVTPAHGADLSLSFSQPLLEGLGTLDSGLRASQARRRAATSRLARAQETLMVRVELAYWDLAEAEAIQAVLQRSLEIADALLFRNRQLADRELIPEVDVLTAGGAVALRRAGFVSARRDREDAADRLTFLAWGSGAGERAAQGSLPLKTRDGPATAATAGAQDTQEVQRIAEAALARRRDVAAAAAALLAAVEIRRDARRGVLPSLTVDGSLGTSASGSSLSGALGGLNGNRAWSLGLSFSQPLLNRRDRGVGYGADLAVELRRLELALVQNQVHLEVRAALRALEAGRERSEAAAEAASLVRAQLEAERRRLDLGLGDSFRLLETEENSVQAELEEVRARYDLARAHGLYRLATGSIQP